MVNLLKDNRGTKAINGILQMMRLETWQEQSFITIPLNEGVDCVTIGFDRTDPYFPILVREFVRFSNSNSSVF